jgi:YD repeat-containing protein
LVIGGPRSVKPFCSRGRLTRTTLPDGSEITCSNYNWLAAGQIQSPGASKTLTYDALLRPAQIEIRNQATQLLASRSYQYDKAGNISQIDSEAGTTRYSYDRLNRLTQAKPDDNLKAQGLPWEQYSNARAVHSINALAINSTPWAAAQLTYGKAGEASVRALQSRGHPRQHL